VGGVPWEPIPGREGIEIKSSVNLPKDESEIKETEAGVEKEIVKRRMKIVKEDIREFGMTAGCKGCIAVNRGGQAVNHSEICRNRIGDELVKRGDARVTREKEKWEEELTGALEEEEKEINKERSEEEEMMIEERLFGEERESEERDVNDEEKDIVMELSKSVRRWDSEIEVMIEKLKEENLFWGDLNEVRQNSHVIGKKYWDDLSGEELDPSMVMAARSEELFVKHNVYK
jgi:hypothetical protein